MVSRETAKCSKKMRFPACGSVEAHLTTDHGVIQDLRFTGDFFSVVEPEVLAEKLRGVRFEEQMPARGTGRRDGEPLFQRAGKR